MIIRSETHNGLWVILKVFKIMDKNKSGYPSYLPKGSDASCFLRLNQVLDIVPIGKSTVYYLMAKGEFPKQIKLGPKMSVWKRSDIDAYIAKHSGGADE